MITFALFSYIFVPFSYTYVLIALYFKNTSACSKPVSSISDKLYCSKLSGPALNGP